MKEKASPMVTAAAIIVALALVGGLGYYFMGRSSTPIMITPPPDHVKQMTRGSGRPGSVPGGSSSGGPPPAGLTGSSRPGAPPYANPSGGSRSPSGGYPGAAPGSAGSSSSGTPQ